jgi:hypothetical protein
MSRSRTPDVHAQKSEIMTIRRLNPEQWTGFCAHVSHVLIGKQVKIEIASLQIGAQLEAGRLPLLGMSYHPHDDVLELLAGDLDHLICRPRELYVDEAPLGIICLQIVDADGLRQIVTLSDPPMLPKPADLQS